MSEYSHAQPKYAMVAGTLLEQIRRGEFPPGQRLPSEPTLAERFGVSRVTVRHAIATLIRDGVLETQRGLGHVVRADNLSRTIGLLFNRPVFGRTTLHTNVSAFPVLLFNAIRQQLHDRGCRERLYLPAVGATEHHLDYQTLLEDVRRERFSGLISVSWRGLAHVNDPMRNAADAELRQLLERKRIPVAAVSGRDIPFATTSLDYRAIGHTGAKYFLDRGVRRIGLITGKTSPLRSTMPGFRDAMQAAGAVVRAPWVLRLDRRCESAGFDAFRRLWAQRERPEALVIDDDIVGKGAMTAAAMMGAGDDRTLQIACQYVAGSELFIPRPFVKLEIDPMRFAHDAVYKTLSMVNDPLRGAAPRSWLKPRLIEPAADPFAPWLADPADATASMIER